MGRPKGLASYFSRMGKLGTPGTDVLLCQVELLLRETPAVSMVVLS